MALNAMVKANADEVPCLCARPSYTHTISPLALLLATLQCVLETELTNSGALRLYEKLGFVRHKRCGTFKCCNAAVRKCLNSSIVVAAYKSII